MFLLNECLLTSALSFGQSFRWKFVWFIRATRIHTDHINIISQWHINNTQQTHANTHRTQRRRFNCRCIRFVFWRVRWKKALVTLKLVKQLSFFFSHIFSLSKWLTQRVRTSSWYLINFFFCSAHRISSAFYSVLIWVSHIEILFIVKWSCYLLDLRNKKKNSPKQNESQRNNKKKKTEHSIWNPDKAKVKISVSLCLNLFSFKRKIKAENW